MANRSGYPGRDLGRWSHGSSNALECQSCEFTAAGLTDAQALRVARRHQADTGHEILQERTLSRFIRHPAG
jgi:hypothetical protein